MKNALYNLLESNVMTANFLFICYMVKPKHSCTSVRKKKEKQLLVTLSKFKLETLLYCLK